MLTNTTNVVNAVRYAVRTREDWEAFMTENNVTRETIAATAKEIASLAFPSDEPVQKVDGKRTRYGNAVQAAAYMMRAVLAEAEVSDAPEADWLKKILADVDKGVTAGLDASAIREAVNEHVKSLLS